MMRIGTMKRNTMAGIPVLIVFAVFAAAFFRKLPAEDAIAHIAAGLAALNEGLPILDKGV